MPRSRVTFSPIGEGIGEGHDGGQRPEAEERGEGAPALSTEGQDRTSRGQSDDQEQLVEPEERVLRLLGVHDEQRSLEEPQRDEHRPHSDRGPVEAHPAAEEGGDSRQAEEEERERRQPERKDGQPRREPRPPELQSLQRTEARGEAGRIRIGPREERSADDDGEHAGRPARRLPPLPAGQRGEQGGRGDDGDQRDDVVPDEACGEVVEQAVSDQRVVARVPERVPDEDAVAHELGAVEVRRQVARRRAEEHEGDPDDERDPPPRLEFPAWLGLRRSLSRSWRSWPDRRRLRISR